MQEGAQHLQVGASLSLDLTVLKTTPSLTNRYMVMNVKMEARTWEQLLFILLQITQLTLPETPPRKRADTLGRF